jgi:NDP-4-keto-2,6-dideoxyhexose 3-C-methyltransferase
MLDAVGYDNICHEHLEYYHLAPMETLLAAHGLEVFHVERRQINGGSFRAYIGWQGRHEIDPSVARMRAEERERFADPAALWQAFAHLTNQRQAELMVAVDLIAEFGPVDVYGASTKGNTLLQACHLDARTIRQAWERSPEKIGRYISVTGIPIVSEEAGRREPPAALLVLPWGFRQAFVAREQGYLATGGRLIFPLPQVEVVTAAGVLS